MEYNPFKKDLDLLEFEPDILDSPTRDQIEADRIIEGITGANTTSVIDPFSMTRNSVLYHPKTNIRHMTFYTGEVRVEGECIEFIIQIIILGHMIDGRIHVVFECSGFNQEEVQVHINLNR